MAKNPLENSNTTPTAAEIRETISAARWQHEKETAIAFAKLELLELENGKRELGACPGIAKLAEMGALRTWALKIPSA